MRAVALAAGGALEGCGGGSGAGTTAVLDTAGGETVTALAAAPAPGTGAPIAPAPSPPPPQAVFAQPGVTAGVVTGKYRYEQTRLFQSVPARTIPSRLPGGAAYLWEGSGPTNIYVDSNHGWPWTRTGGDWLDADSVRHGSHQRGLRVNRRS